MQNCDLSGADLRGAGLSGVDVRALRMKNTTIDLEQAVVIAQGLGARLG